MSATASWVPSSPSTTATRSADSMVVGGSFSPPGVAANSSCFHSQQVSAAVQRELGPRVSRLRIKAVRTPSGRTLALNGSTSSYYLKQLASQAAMAVLPSNGSVVVQNDLLVEPPL